MTFFFLLLSVTGDEIAPYLPTLMDTMLSALNNAEDLKIKELAVSAIGAIGQSVVFSFIFVHVRPKKPFACVLVCQNVVFCRKYYYYSGLLFI